MRMAVLTIDGARPAPRALDQAAQVISRGEVVAAPTETRYGLLARADEQGPVSRLFDLKQRDFKQATAIFVQDIKQAAELGVLNPVARELFERFMPGPMTLVVKAVQDWPPPRVVGGKIGLRCSSAATIKGLLDRMKVPLTATSANISGESDAESVEELMAVFGNRVSLYLNAGPLAGPVSTVVDCTVDPVRIVRAGAISREEIKQTLGGRNVE